MAQFSIDNDDLIKLFDELAVRVPAKVPEALEKMVDGVLKPALVAAAPYDSKHHKVEQKHLKDVIVRTNVRGSKKGGHYVTVFVNPRGIPGAKPGKRAKQNWDADKYVFKLVVAEYGSSKQAPKPFWEKTVKSCESKMIETAAEIINNEVQRCAK